MKRHELLVPVGNMECLKQAVYNGCDAVYMGCKSFGARKFATNFSNSEIVEAIKFCHLYGVSAYVTMNTLVKNSEVDAFLEQASFLHKNGVDALIVQDFGMICLLREKFPNLEIHASTQANISSKEICQLYYDLGVKRVVFSRELSIEEIDHIDVPIEKEAFIHGALCISYSGCCLMSSMLGGRSGNRGECAGSCRMPFSLEKDGKILAKNQYLLSTKELNTSSYIKRLLESSIYSFKIEGRMKSPLYVGFITRLYRRLIDKEDVSLKDATNELKTIFNREFTGGRLFYASDNDIINRKSPNHIGLEIGKVVSVSKDKIKLKLYKGDILHQYDAIRFLNSGKGFIVNFLYNENKQLVNSASGICYVDNKIQLKEVDTFSKTQDYLLEKEFESIPIKKIPISFRVEAFCGKKLRVEVLDNYNMIFEEGEVLSSAINAPTSKENIIKHLNKLNDTPFSCSSYSISSSQNVFIPVKTLNDIRRKLISRLTSIRENSKTCYVENRVLFETGSLSLTNTLEKDSYFVYTEEQMKSCLSLDRGRIYTPNCDLFKQYRDFKNVFYAPKRCLYHVESSLEERSLVSDYANYSKKSVIGNYTLNVMNIYTAYYLQKIGVSSVCLSVELSVEEIQEFVRLYEEKFDKASFEVFGYGRVENMIIKGNILNLLKDSYDYFLIDLKGRKFPVYYDGAYTHILNWEERKIIRKLIPKDCIYRFQFYQERDSEILKIVKRHQ